MMGTSGSTSLYHDGYNTNNNNIKEESCVIRMVNLNESFTESTLKEFILTLCRPDGDIKNIYLKRDNVIKKFFGYVVFEHSSDAKKSRDILNGYTNVTNKLEVELIGPNLRHRKYERNIRPEVSDRVIKLTNEDTVNGAKKKIHQQTHLATKNKDIGTSKYVPPSMRDGARKRTDGPSMARRDDYSAIRIANLSDSTTQTDLADLMKPFGPTQKRYLALDKETGRCKGFAYIHFKFRNDAARAITMLDGYEYDNHILTAGWSSKPLSNSRT